MCGPSTIPGVDASPVFEAAKHVFDLVPLAIEDLIVCDVRPAVGS